jgi:hypothetical protein
MDLSKIEMIEHYYLQVISKYIGSDINGLVSMLESHNKTWSFWYPKVSNVGSYFDTGSERVIYMLLNRGDILGEPNANPIGSDNSFLKYDKYFNCYLAINLDVKSIKANTNLNDVINNIPIGVNQNSYECDIEYYTKNVLFERKHYTPGLLTSYNIEDNHGVLRDYLTISYEIVILYEQLPIEAIPEQEKVIGIFIACIPNGKLFQHYGNRVFDAGKTSNLVLSPNQLVYISNTKTITTKGDENISRLSKNYGLSEKDYYILNGLRNLKWNVDARFNYSRVKNFELLNKEKSRITKLYLNENRLDYQFYNVKENKIQTNPIKRQKNTKEALNFLKNLPFS